MKNTYYSIGLMSGTSLDGLDIALCKFDYIQKDFSWKYEIIQTEYIEYNKIWKQKLQTAHLLSALQLKEVEIEWTEFVIKNVNKFVLQSKGFDFSLIDCISSHGHTVFHQPSSKENKNKQGFTLQIGNGAMLAAQTGFKVVCDFRQTDVALFGQGAPLVPIGDELLFSDYDFCLNLGGIANISFNKNKYRTDKEEKINSRFAFDICPCNMILNELSNQLGFEYDEGGKMAKQGKIDAHLLQQLNNLDFYKENYPKSLGREWVEEFIFPLLKRKEIKEETVIKDLLHTCTYHIAFQIAQSIKNIELELNLAISKKTESIKKKLLITGGGTYNDLLLNYLEELLPNYTIERGNKVLISYKEALIFAFLGVLRLREEVNTLASVTGATKNSCGGSIYLAAAEFSNFSDS